MASTKREDQPAEHGRSWITQPHQGPHDTMDKAIEKEAQASAIINDHVRKTYSFTDIEGQDDWQKLPEIPSGEEILKHIRDAALPKNPIPNDQDPFPKPWTDKKTYLTAHYKLLREDAIRPLKHAIQEFMLAPDLGDSHQTSIYTHVYIRGYTFAQVGAAAKVEFCTERAGKRIRWSQTKRLQQGTIVALSPYKDHFRTVCKVATVAARALADVERDPPRVDIFWSCPEEAEFDPTERYVMVESKSGYFEATRHILVAFQKKMAEIFPLSHYLLNVQADVGAPHFLKSQPLKDLTRLGLHSDTALYATNLGDLENVDILEQFPHEACGSLDSSQMDAVQRILTKEVAIVQGPPGTGKTFVSIAAILVMLRNWSVGDPPIIVSAQTNHALDQLLNKIAVLDDNKQHIVRLGGRAKEDDEMIQSLTLYTRRQQARRYLASQDDGRGAAIQQLKRLGDLMVADINKMNSQPRDEAAIFLESGLITQPQYDSTFNHGWTQSNENTSYFQQWMKSQYGPPGAAPPLGDRFDEEEDTEYEALNEQEMEARKARDDDDLEGLRGRYHEYRQEFVGSYKTERSSATEMPGILAKFSNLEDVPFRWRGAVYQYLKNKQSRKIRGSFRLHMKLYSCLAEDLKVAKVEQNVKLVRSLNIKLIGCTTTGLSIYRSMIAALQPRTLLIEEAAETLEGSIVAGMVESLEQLILVGDHEQLQAQCNVPSLAEAPYNLAVSLFQRLVKNGVEYTMLNTQRRMTAQLSELLGDVYQGLQDHPSVHGRPDVPGMGGRNSYLFIHSWEESLDDSLSRYNVEEAEMVAGFANYLVLDGVNPEHITVLTFYNGQRKKILKFLKEKPSLKNGAPLNVFTVDSYQGEENEIILLSLVRSNEHGNVGFLENKNRAVVALSRARRGLYIFGDIMTLLGNPGIDSYYLWSKAMNVFQGRGEMLIDADRWQASGKLPLICQKHGRVTMVTRARDLDDRGGCDRLCGETMPCGHRCQTTCHWLDHKDMLCKQLCMKSIEACRKGHTCVMTCFQRCQCQCSESELLPPPISMPGETWSATDLSAADRLIRHGLGVARQAALFNGAHLGQSKLQGSQLTHFPKPAVGIADLNQGNRYLPVPVGAQGQPILRDTWPRPILDSDTANGQQHFNPAIVNYYSLQSGLPLTPNAAAALFPAAASAARPIVLTNAPFPPQRIVEVAKRNQINGQLSRPAMDPLLRASALYSTKPLFNAERRAPQSSTRLQSTPGSIPQVARPRAQFANAEPRLSRGAMPSSALNVPTEYVPARLMPPDVPSTQAAQLPSNLTISNSSLPEARTDRMMKIFVAGLPFSYKEAELRSLLRPYGEVRQPELWFTAVGRPAGCGSVTMMRADGQRAIRELNGKVIGERVLKIQKYKRRDARPAQPERSNSAGNAGDDGLLGRKAATATFRAEAVPFIPKIQRSHEPPQGEARNPDIVQLLQVSRSKPVAGDEMDWEGTERGTVVGDDERWQMGREGMREGRGMEVGGDLMDLADGEDGVEGESEDLMTFSSPDASLGMKAKATSAGIRSLLDEDDY